MKFNQYSTAYTTLRKLSSMNFPVREAYKIFMLYKEIEKSLEFGVQKEQELMEKYDGRQTQDGYIEFVHGDDDEAIDTGTKNMEAFKKEINELHEMEVPMEFTPIVLNYDSFGDQTITPTEIMSLDGFVSFE